MSSSGSDGADTGVEYNAHMTNDGAPGSHSAEFGLGAKDGEKSKQSDGPQPGAPIANEKDLSGGGSQPKPAEPEAKTSTMADGSSTSAPPGAGSTKATASQGTGKVGE